MSASCVPDSIRREPRSTTMKSAMRTVLNRWDTRMVIRSSDLRAAVAAAVDRAGASDVVPQLVAGVEAQLGATWPAGVALSLGRWPKVAPGPRVTRGCPLV